MDGLTGGKFLSTEKGLFFLALMPLVIWFRQITAIVPEPYLVSFNLKPAHPRQKILI